MAEVFKAKAFGVEGFEKILAIKRILPAMAEDQDFVQMFIDEARIAGQLSHANVCQIFELGRIADSHFIAMEYIWGKDLLQMQNRFRRLKQDMPPPMAVFVGCKICEGLDYAHRKKDAQGKSLGIIHRDVSPQNVLVSYEGEVKLIDFGIAKAVGRSSKTQAGVLKGKFGYMSPEQVRGLPIDRRSDVFAIGTIMHEILTGQRLFVADSDFATLDKVRNVDVRTPSQVNPRVPAELDRIVMRALAKNPDDRYQWANEMQEELQAFGSREEPFTSKQLAQWMRETFAAELKREQQMLELYKRVGRDGKLPDAGDWPTNNTGGGGVGTGESSQAQATGPAPMPEPVPVAPSVKPGSSGKSAVPVLIRPVGPTFIPTGDGEEVTITPTPTPASESDPTRIDSRFAQQPMPSIDDEATIAEPPRVQRVEPETSEAATRYQTRDDRDHEHELDARGEIDDDDDDDDEGEGEDCVDDEKSVSGPYLEPEPELAHQPTAIFSKEQVSAPPRPAEPPVLMLQPPPPPGRVPTAQPPNRALSPAPRGLTGAPTGAPTTPRPLHASPPPPPPRAPFGGPRGLKLQPNGLSVPRQAGRRELFKEIAIGVGVAGTLLVAMIAVVKLVKDYQHRSTPATLIVTVSVPRAAQVKVHGNNLDQTGRVELGVPAVFKNLKPGSFDVEVAADGAPPFRRTVQLGAGDTEVIPATLLGSDAPPLASLRLDVKPAGATIWVDGIEFPLGEPIALRAGKHAIRVAKDNFAEQTVMIETRAGQQLEQHIELVPQQRSGPQPGDESGSIEVTSEPAGADVLVNGQLQGLTPMVLDGLELNRTYKVTLRHAGRQSVTKTFVLTPRTPRDRLMVALPEPRATPTAVHNREPPSEIVHAPSPSPTAAVVPANAEQGLGTGTGQSDGYLIANTQPFARVVIDGKDTGKSTPIAPKSKVPLRAGKHVVSFIYEGKQFDYEILVRAGEDTRLIRKLETGN
jgi:serine/threonine protein kinase